jgi:hypothetical protein
MIAFWYCEHVRWKNPQLFKRNRSEAANAICSWDGSYRCQAVGWCHLPYSVGKSSYVPWFLIQAWRRGSEPSRDKPQTIIRTSNHRRLPFVKYWILVQRSLQNDVKSQLYAFSLRWPPQESLCANLSEMLWVGMDFWLSQQFSLILVERNLGQAEFPTDPMLDGRFDEQWIACGYEAFEVNE